MTLFPAAKLLGFGAGTIGQRRIYRIVGTRMTTNGIAQQQQKCWYLKAINP
jgi:hypothetical protein